MKLEANKTYVFISDEAKVAYLSNHHLNKSTCNVNYKDGFTLTMVGHSGSGYVGDAWAIDEDEIEFFKEKESAQIEVKVGDVVSLKDDTGVFIVHSNDGCGLLLVAWDDRLWKYTIEDVKTVYRKVEV